MRGLIASILAVSIALAVALPAAAASPSEAAHLCAGNGFKNFQRVDGTVFQNPGECISYAVHTGSLEEVLQANSVDVGIGGAAQCLGPDEGGDLSCFEGLVGCISGTLNNPGCPAQNTGYFRYDNQYVWHADGSASGDGTAICVECVVAGLTGEVDFVTTGQGQGTPSLDFPLMLSSGTWQISSATGGLSGLSGSGTWSLDPNTGDHTYSGTVKLPV